MYQLVIAEKPSVAQSLAAVLGAGQRREGYLEGNGWLVSWCVGHLAELADAAAYNPAYAKWRKEDLPILPESWRFTIAKDKRDQFDVLRTLLRREDAARAETENFLSKVYGGSLGLMMSAMAQSKALTEEDIAELSAILERAGGAQA